MQQPYKPLLADRLSFPPEWVAVSFQITSFECSYKVHYDIISAMAFYNTVCEGCALPGNHESGWLFFHWHEIETCMYERQARNIRFCGLADLLTWQLKGIGAELPTQNQLELF